MQADALHQQVARGTGQRAICVLPCNLLLAGAVEQGSVVNGLRSPTTMLWSTTPNSLDSRYRNVWQEMG